MKAGEFTRFLDVFAPQICLSCGAAGGIFCASCTHSIGRVQSVRGVVDLGQEKVPGFSGAIYSETVRDCLVGVKRTGSPELYRLLVPVVAQAVVESLERVNVRRPLAFVPISSGAKTRRGFGGNLVRSLLIDSIRLLHSQDQLPSRPRIMLHDHLESRRVKQSQKFQLAADRSLNIRGALQAAPGSAECVTATHVLFDDIMTTGSTVREAARALGQIGIEVDAVVTVAARPRALGLPVTR